MNEDQRPAHDGSGDYGRRRRASGRTPSGAGAPGIRRAPRRDGGAGLPRSPELAAPTLEPEVVRPARELLEEILAKLGIADATVAYYARSEGEYLEVRAPDLGNLIGRRGQTLEALNLVFNNIVNAGVRSNRRYYTIDAEGYRARRADLLKGLALATLERAIREKRPISLEPMLPSERKVIHIALAENPFVSTESSGAEPERRVVVIPR